MLDGVSIVVPIFNRSDVILPTLESLGKQSYESENLEIIIVDDGSTDESPQIIERYQVESEIPITLKRQEQLGPSAARNKGASIAKYELLLFLDADIIADSSLFQQHVETQTSRGPALVAGSRRFWSQAMITPYSSIMNRNSLEKDQYWRHSPSFQEVFSSNFSIQKDLFWEIGGFDESLRAYEDIDFAYRAMLASVNLVFCKEAVGYHNHSVTLDEACRQQETYQKYAAAFLRKHPELVGQLNTLVDKGPINWGSDQPSLVLRKLFHLFLALGPTLAITTKSAKIFEKRPISDRFIRRLYWAVLGAYQLRGYREGLTIYQ